MELKLLTDDDFYICIASSNRTFMELKYQKICNDHYQFRRSNRTFMELKYKNAT